MERKYTQRPFIYRSREDIDAFLAESQLWIDLYQLFIRIKDNSFRFKLDETTFFNEVCYQCVRVLLEDHPEKDVYNNYLNDAKDNLGTRYASDLCFSMVYAVLSLMKNVPLKVNFFLEALLNKKLKTEMSYFPYIEQYVNEKKSNGTCYGIDLSPKPELPDVMKNTKTKKETILNCCPHVFYENVYGPDWWKFITQDFDQDAIRDIVNIWSSKKDRIEILRQIEEAYNLYEDHKFDIPFL